MRTLEQPVLYKGLPDKTCSVDDDSGHPSSCGLGLRVVPASVATPLKTSLGTGPTTKSFPLSLTVSTRKDLPYFRFSPEPEDGTSPYCVTPEGDSNGPRHPITRQRPLTVAHHKGRRPLPRYLSPLTSVYTLTHKYTHTEMYMYPRPYVHSPAYIYTDTCEYPHSCIHTIRRDTVR